MKLTAVVKLLPTEQQRDLLLKTLQRANAACDFASASAWEAKQFSQAGLHKLTYYPIRERCQLSAQMAVRCIGKVVDAYKRDKRTQRAFKPHGAIAYDSRILKWSLETQEVSIWTLAGRERIAFVCGAYHHQLLNGQRGETDLVYRKGKFFLYTTCEVEADSPMEVEDFLGVDLGVRNIATDSDGEIHSASHLLNVRHRYSRLRRKLQKKGTKSAKRLLKKRSLRESRFAKDVNHQISKHLVQKAQDSGRGIALEDLTHIRTRVTVQRRRRDDLHSWAFADLRVKFAYKAERAGIPVECIDARYTSQQCSCCGHTARSNRPNQSTFRCQSCGFVSHADWNAAVNIGRRAAVSPPYAVCVLGLNPATTASSRL
ncbi:MAG: transposase [Anaerolineae bacterium]|nr:transposase [Anaerolineae bacterium]